MILSVYSIFDDKAKVYVDPYYFAHDGQAKRAFGEMVVGKRMGLLSSHPQDFHLYKLGDFDNSSGRFISCDVPEFLCHALDYVKDKEVRNGISTEVDESV